MKGITKITKTTFFFAMLIGVMRFASGQRNSISDSEKVLEAMRKSTD